MTTGERLRHTREDHDELQKDLAKGIGYSLKQIGRWERDESDMTAKAITAVCNYYKISADYLLGLPENLERPR